MLPTPQLPRAAPHSGEAHRHVSGWHRSQAAWSHTSPLTWSGQGTERPCGLGRTTHSHSRMDVQNEMKTYGKHGAWHIVGTESTLAVIVARPSLSAQPVLSLREVRPSSSQPPLRLLQLLSAAPFQLALHPAPLPTRICCVQVPRRWD